jgi:hypothetical protein
MKYFIEGVRSVWGTPASPTELRQLGIVLAIFGPVFILIFVCVLFAPKGKKR